MMRRRTVVSHVLAFGFSMSGQVLAQQAPNPAPVIPKPVEMKPAPAQPAPPVAPAPAAAPAPAPAPAAAPPVADAPPTPEPAPQPAPLPAQPAPPPAAEALPPPADPEPDLPPPVAEVDADESYSWYDAIQFSAFADAYFSLNYNMPKPQSGRNWLRAHDTTNGFALAWVGVNASYPADPVGATVSLRFGPAARQIAACSASDQSQCDSGQGLENVKQAFASWKPAGSDSSFQLDFGKFETPFGAEVSESHLNMNYTRSMLYASQPVTHTGLRASFAVADALEFKLLAVNGWNNSIDNNVGKSLGAQAVFHLKAHDSESDLLTAALGYMGGPERDDSFLVTCGPGTSLAPVAAECVANAGNNATESKRFDRGSSNWKGLRHLVDLVVLVNPIERLRLVLNADYGTERQRVGNTDQFNAESYYGVLLGARYSIIDEFAIAARGEYFHDPSGFLTRPRPDYSVNFVGGTLTLDYQPSDFLTIRLDNRYDWASRQIFAKDVRETATGGQFTSTLGVVAHTD